ncbi:SPASM domain-containing protein [Actinomadura meridiana]
MIEVLSDQDLTGGVEMLTMLGITDITRDHTRPVGRASRRGSPATGGDLCGRCGDGRAAIDTHGRLMPCVLGRGFDAGNVTETPLAELLDGAAWRRIVARIPRRAGAGHGCNPNSDGNDCSPAETEACNPAYNDD